MKNYFKISSFSSIKLFFIVVLSSTAFVYLLRLWLNFDACSPKFLLNVLLVITLSSSLCVVTFFFYTKFKFFKDVFLLLNNLYTLALILSWVLPASTGYFYLFFACFVGNFVAKAMSLLDFKFRSSKNLLKGLDYYSSFLLVNECQIIFGTSINTNFFHSFFLKLLGFGFCLYSFLCCHTMLFVVALWLPSLIVPYLVVQLLFVLLLVGVGLFFLATNSFCLADCNLLFEGKVYLKFNREMLVWLLGLAFILYLSSLVIVVFNCASYGFVGKVLWYTPIRFIIFDFCFASVFFFLL